MEKFGSIAESEAWVKFVAAQLMTERFPGMETIIWRADIALDAFVSRLTTPHRED